MTIQQLMSRARMLMPELIMRENVDMRDYTTFRIGGLADLMIEPRTFDQLYNVWRCLRDAELPVYVLGNGSNMLVADEGLRGAVIRLTSLSDVNVNIDVNIVTAQCGARLSKLAAVACNSELAGLSFAAGIPGTVGGAVYMNAGAYGGQMSDAVTRTTYLDSKGDYHELRAGEHNFGYRRSFFSNTPGCLILETEVKLGYGHTLDIKREMDEMAEKRRQKQPLSHPSAGSVFKRPEGHFAGSLIEQCGLKGVSIGGAQISEKHAGFIVNIGGATCSDVLKLIELIQKTVQMKTGVSLEPELKVVR